MAFRKADGVQDVPHPPDVRADHVKVVDLARDLLDVAAQPQRIQHDHHHRAGGDRVAEHQVGPQPYDGGQAQAVGKV